MPMTKTARNALRSAVWLVPLLVTWHISTPAVADCEASVSLVDFGRLDLEEGGDVSGEVTVICDEPGRFSVALSEGRGSFRLRKMKGSNGSELRYNLFVDSGRRSVWGDGVSSGTQTIRGESDGRRPLSIPVYGTVPPRQSVVAGPYSDNLLVTVENL